MSKRSKKNAASEAAPPAKILISASREPHRSKKQPSLLAISIVLFAIWFVFLLVSAVLG